MCLNIDLSWKMIIIRTTPALVPPKTGITFHLSCVRLLGRDIGKFNLLLIFPGKTRVVIRISALFQDQPNRPVRGPWVAWTRGPSCGTAVCSPPSRHCSSSCLAARCCARRVWRPRGAIPVCVRGPRCWRPLPGCTTERLHRPTSSSRRLPTNLSLVPARRRARTRRRRPSTSSPCGRKGGPRRPLKTPPRRLIPRPRAARWRRRWPQRSPRRPLPTLAWAPAWREVNSPDIWGYVPL